MSVETPVAGTATSGAVTRRLRVAVLTRNFSPAAGGAERYAIAMVEHLAARHDIKVFAQTIEHRWPNVAYQKISAPATRPRWVNQLWFAGATWWATRRGFDVVHSHENTWHGDVQTVHVLPVKHNLFKNRGGRTKFQQALSWAGVLTSPRLMVYLALERFRYAPKPGRRVVVTSQTLLDLFSKSFPAAMVFTSVVTPGIELPATRASHQSQSASRVLLGLPIDVPCVIFVGNDFRKKGLQTLIEAFSQLPKEVILAVVGGSNQIDLYRQQAVDAGLVSRVFFLGALLDTKPAYLSATCLVHPTREDTFAMVVLEAMAFGLPVVVSNATFCGVAAMLQHQENALLLSNPRDPVELAETIEAALRGVLSKSGLGDRAREFAKNFEWSRLADQQDAVYFDSVHAKSESSESSGSTGSSN